MDGRAPAIIVPMSYDWASVFKRIVALAAVLAVSACGWAEFPSTRSGPQTSHAPSDIDAFINATAVTVGRGDTLYSIARRHRLSPRDIIDANNLRPPYALNVGQRLKLPPGQLHVVRSGEFLASIGKRYGVDGFSIARINGIRAPYTIYPGQKLRIPRTTANVQVASAPPSPAPSPMTAEPPSQTMTVTPTRPAPTQPANKADVPEPPKRAGTFAWPVRGRVISAYGPKEKGLHNDGINIEVPRGTEVKAAENGVVAYAGNEIRGFGNLLLLKHDGGWVTAYAHNDQLLVKRGDRVSRGQVISKAGSTGSVASPQLHFELRKGSDAVDPSKYM
ncbi:MAG: M23 family metallopeptidase [Rhodospirillales bacterium]|nr:M23 family metallopeptidase [Rhodospirillales bacterium]